MLPYLAGRPVNLHRFPNGIDKPGFWHKAVPATRPSGSQRWRNDDADPGETEQYFVLDSAAGAGVGRELRRHRAASVDVDRRRTRTSRRGR